MNADRYGTVEKAIGYRHHLMQFLLESFLSHKQIPSKKNKLIPSLCSVDVLQKYIVILDDFM